MTKTILKDNTFEVLEQIPVADIAALENSLAADAVTKDAPAYKADPIGLICRAPSGKLQAGLTGKFFWNWLYIDMLWVDATMRHQGVGTSLMHKAEQLALARRCCGIYLWTESFQAPAFYQKQGYEIFCQFPDFPKGHQRIGLRKIFSAAKMREWPDDIGLSGTSRTMKGTDGYV